jgi:hypothetical protein
MLKKTFGWDIPKGQGRREYWRTLEGFLTRVLR